MYWTWTRIADGKKYISWGQPQSLDRSEFREEQADFNVDIYSGQKIKPEDSVIMMMSGDATLGLGDSIWLMTFMRQVYKIKSRRRCRFVFCSNPIITEFYSHFLPSSFELREEYITKKEFDGITYKLPAMYYWRDTDGADRSWCDNQSLISRLYNWSGLEYNGLPDWGEFTDEKILYPGKSYYEHLGIDPKDKYVFFQWHSSGHSKNLPPKTNIKIIRHIIKTYGYKVYVIGRLNCLDGLEKIDGVKNLSGKTMVSEVFSLAFNSEFIVCPDSAGIHLGEAYRIPTVGIMATLPPVYVAYKYQIPTFMFGSGHCPYRPCGIVHKLPIDTKCPKGTKNYCATLEDVDLDVFDNCIRESFENRNMYGSKSARNFYNGQKEAINFNKRF